MKVVIMAAGRGTRLGFLTENTPKPMLPLLGKPLLEHLLESLPESVDEVILVVGYRADQIQKYFGERFKRFRMRYVHQGKPEGTARALALTRELLGKGKFLSLYADDLHGKEDLEALTKHPLSVLVKEVENPERYGVVTLADGNQVVSITEKPSQPTSNLVVTGPAVLDERIFAFEPPKHHSGEYYLAEAIGKLVGYHPVAAVEQEFWLPIGYPEDLSRAETVMKNRVNSKTSLRSKKK